MKQYDDSCPVCFNADVSWYPTKRERSAGGAVVRRVL